MLFWECILVLHTYQPSTYLLKKSMKHSNAVLFSPLWTGNLFTLILHHQEPTSSTEQIAFSTAQLSWNSQTGIQDTHDACPVVKLCISASLRWASHHPSLSLRFFGGTQRSQNMQVCFFFRRRYRTTNPNNALLFTANPSKLSFLLFGSPKMGNLWPLSFPEIKALEVLQQLQNGSLILKSNHQQVCAHW